MNTATQNLIIKDNQFKTIRYTKIVQQEWLKKIELGTINEQLKVRMTANLARQHDYKNTVLNTINSGKARASEKVMNYLFPALVVLLAVIILV